LPTTKEAKRASVAATVNKINKKYADAGRLLIIKASEVVEPIRIPTGIFSLDTALDGGFPCGRWSIVAGRLQSGKSTMCFRAIANAQKMGLRALYINTEARFKKEWAAKQGVNLDELMLVQLEKETSAEDIAQCYIDSAMNDVADLIIIDSMTAMSPNREMNNPMDQESMGLAPQVFSKFFRKATPPTTAANNRRGVCAILVAQYRDTMDKYAKAIANIPGGNAKNSYANYVLMCNNLSPAAGVNRVTKDTGFVMGINMLKTDNVNRGKIRLEFIDGVGIDVTSDIIDSAIRLGVIEKQGGGYYQFKNELGELVRVRSVKSLTDSITSSPELVEGLRLQLEDVRKSGKMIVPLLAEDEPDEPVDSSDVEEEL
jgi:recombination protein RecA